MKRPAGSDFDDDGTKFFQSPQYKEVKTEMSAEESSKMKEFSKRFSADTDKETKVKRERFYDLYTRVSNDPNFKIDIDGLNLSLNIRIEEFPEDSKITAMFEELNSKSSMIARGKKNWSEPETFLCIWIIMVYCHLNDRDFNDMADRDWDAVARIFPGKGADQCKARWQGLLKTNLTKAPWTQEEDKTLMGIIQEKGPKKWKEIASELNKKMVEYKIFRQGKQCRERWINHLDPAINRGAWSSEEDVKLLETHLHIGKKWAEISKVLKNRTENAVKNRWNSLMKKYKGEFGMDIDTLSTSSAYSNQSIDNLEKKIAEMIISSRRSGKDSKSYSPTEPSPYSKILEVNEEESPEYQSDLSVETPLKSEDSYKPYGKDDFDGKGGQKKGAAAANKKKPAVHTAKSLLRDMITEEIQNQPQGQSFQPSTNSSESSLSRSDKALSAQKMYAFEDQNTLNTANQEQIISSQGPYSAGPMPLYSQNVSGNGPEMMNMSNDLNAWRNNINMGVFNQNAQQNTMSPNFFGLYSPGSFLHHPGFNLSSALLPVPDSSNNNLQQQQQQQIQPQPQPQPQGRSTGLLKLNEAKGGEPEPTEMRSYTLTQKPVTQLNLPETGQPGLFYAVVDLSGGQMFLLDQVHKNNFPPVLNQGKQKMETSLTNLDFFGNSPALNHASWKSPPINTANLMNYPLFNNPLASFGLPQNQFSPNLNLFQNPREHNFFESTPKMESIGGEWTPDAITNRPLFSGLNMKQYMGYTNMIGDTPPDMKLGNGAFIKRMEPGPQAKTNTGVPPSAEAGKFSSPSSFLTTSQPSNLTRKVVNTGFEKI